MHRLGVIHCPLQIKNVQIIRQEWSQNLPFRHAPDHPRSSEVLRVASFLTKSRRHDTHVRRELRGLCACLQLLGPVRHVTSRKKLSDTKLLFRSGQQPSREMSRSKDAPGQRVNRHDMRVQMSASESSYEAIAQCLGSRSCLAEQQDVGQGAASFDVLRGHLKTQTRPSGARPSHDEDRAGVIIEHPHLSVIPSMHGTHPTTDLRQHCRPTGSFPQNNDVSSHFLVSSAHHVKGWKSCLIPMGRVRMFVVGHEPRR